MRPLTARPQSGRFLQETLLKLQLDQRRSVGGEPSQDQGQNYTPSTTTPEPPTRPRTPSVAALQDSDTVLLESSEGKRPKLCVLEGDELEIDGKPIGFAWNLDASRDRWDKGDEGLRAMRAAIQWRRVDADETAELHQTMKALLQKLGSVPLESPSGQMKDAAEQLSTLVSTMAAACEKLINKERSEHAGLLQAGGSSEQTEAFASVMASVRRVEETQLATLQIVNAMQSTLAGHSARESMKPAATEEAVDPMVHPQDSSSGHDVQIEGASLLALAADIKRLEENQRVSQNKILEILQATSSLKESWDVQLSSLHGRVRSSSSSSELSEDLPLELSSKQLVPPGHALQERVAKLETLVSNSAHWSKQEDTSAEVSTSRERSVPLDDATQQVLISEVKAFFQEEVSCWKAEMAKVSDMLEGAYRNAQDWRSASEQAEAVSQILAKTSQEAISQVTQLHQALDDITSE
mmetsp:Transcript_2568/g.6537  ORF Transcript_2568/g.6537 Transcript_2568/m.6537 type:complete len:466 (+) Transcript_2568:108-1505(+)